MVILPRRSFLTGALAVIAAPAIVRASSLMPVRNWDRGLTLDHFPTDEINWTASGGSIGPFRYSFIYRDVETEDEPRGLIAAFDHEKQIWPRKQRHRPEPNHPPHPTSRSQRM